MGSSAPLRGPRSSAVAVAVLLATLLVLPPVAGDGMPAYHITDVDPGDPRIFSSTFESRQLARVDLVNDTHQRISLFLSVYSLDPGKNLSIMVPLRTLPVDVTGEPMKESEFRDVFQLDKAEKEVVEQDPEKALDKLWEETSSALQTCFGSMLLTYPGEYMRERFHVAEDNGKGEDSFGGDSRITEEPEPVQHYEFDGFSIDVFGVDAAGVLEDYLTTKGLVIPEGGGLDRYNGQYVAVIEAESKPPVDPWRYELARTWAPNTTLALIDQLRERPKLTSDERYDLKRSLERQWKREVKGIDLDEGIYYDLDRTFDELVDAVYGSTDFEGEVLTVELSLDGGRMFFPLGTSAGWPNEVGDIDILFKVPEDRDLEIVDSKDAYFNGSHWYLFQMELANPGFDLDSPVKEGDEGRRVEAARADWTYENSRAIGYLTALVILLVLWFGFALLLRRGYGMDGRLLRNPVLWAMLGLSFLVSIPGALLVYLMLRPLPGREALSQLETTTTMAMYPAAIIMLVLAVIL